MIAWASRLTELRERIDSLIKSFGPNVPVGPTRTYQKATGSFPAGEYLDDVGVQIEMVYIDKKTGLIVGDEANDYQPKEGEMLAFKIS